MPELKNLFVKGKMNKDLDERLLPQGEYRDALNISVSYSEGSDVGTLENILGNGSALDSISLTNASCIGSVRDTENDKIYWFITSTSKDLIVELDGSTVSPIVVDAGSSILNFSTNKDNYITGLNILDGILYFTDNLNEPKQIDINYWKGKSNNDFNTTTDHLSEDRITVIKKDPLNAPVFATLDESLVGGVGTHGGNNASSGNININNININGSITDLIISSDGTSAGTIANYAVDDIISLTREFTAADKTIQKSEARIQITSVDTANKDFNATLLTKSSNIQSDSVSYDAILEEDTPLFELKFTYFSYRYKYKNGQYSTMSPFSYPSFKPGDFDYDSKKGYNLGLQNTIRKIEIKGWADEFAGSVSAGKITPANNTYEADIEEIEVLYKDSVSSNIYIADTLKLDSNGDFDEKIEIKDEQIFKAIESNQLLRPFDSVPRIAKSQEIVANRLIYGNYKHNFNFTDVPTFTTSLVTRTDDTFSQKFSIKSGRSYQVGIVFQDKYGRQTPVFSNKTGIINKEYKDSDALSQIQVSTSVTPPTEATHFKYYVKEVSEPYHNLVLANFYQDEDNGFIFLAFPTSERNKISEDDYLILKKNGKNEAYKSKNNRFKIIDIDNDPPDFLATDFEQNYKITAIQFGKGQSADGNNVTDHAQLERWPGKTPVEGHSSFILSRARGEDNANAEDVSPGAATNLVAGKKIKFVKGGQTSKTYEIAGPILSDDNTVHTDLVITLASPFGNDIEFIYDDPDNAASQYSSVSIIVVTENEGNKLKFQNKFFVKVDANSFLINELLNFTFDINKLSIIDTKFINGEAYDGTNAVGQWGERNWGPASTTGIQEFTIRTLQEYNTTNGDSLESDYDSQAFLSALRKGNYIRLGRGGHVPSSAGIWNTGSYAEIYELKKVTKGLITDYTASLGVTMTLDRGLAFVLKPVSAQQAAPITKIDVLKLNDDLDSLDNPPVFEVEAENGVLDIYYETSKTYPISSLSSPKKLSYMNCFSFGNGVESDRIRDDFNAPTLGKGVRVSTTFEDNYQEETLKTGLIYSGIYNSKNGINRLNQFIIAEKITKDLNPEYGSIQLLHTRDTDIIAFCEDKLVKIFANKDALFNADGNPNLVSTNLVLGQAVIPPTFGAYGISKNPESFVDHTYRVYFTDKNRGKVLRLSIDGVTEISNYGMKDYFKDKLSSNTGLIIGSFDENKGQYNITFSDDTVSFSESVNGWPSRKSFIPESGISLNNMYYTFKDGHIYKHDNTTRNTFYGAKTDSEVTFYLNGNPGNIKNFRTLNYQGDSGWSVKSALNSNSSYFGVVTDKQTGLISSFVKKEGIYYNYISGNTQATKASLDLKALNVQGLGTPTSISSNDATFTDLNNAIQVGDKVFNNSNDNVRTVQSISGNTITLDAAPTNAFSYFAKDNRFNTSGILGYYAEITMTNTATDKKELYSVGSEVSLSS